MNKMKLSNKGFELIKEFEGVRYKAYKCSAGIWTIYIGLITVNGKPVKEGQTITEEEGKAEFLKQIITYENCVNNLITANITQNKYDALVSFAFNLGCGALKSSTLLKKLNVNPNDPTIKDEFLKWNRAGGKVVEGLTRRRIKEAALYFTK